MLLYRSFAYVVLLGCIIITANFIYIHKTVLSRKTFPVESSKEYAKFGGQMSMKLSTEDLPTLKPFIYLTQTEQCLPSNLSAAIGDNDTCNCDVIVLSFKAKCTEATPSHVTYLFEPRSTWGSGRNALYFNAMGRTSGYHYYIFIDDDITFSFSDLTPPEMKNMQPLRAVQEWLLDYEPALGVLDYNEHHGAKWTLKRRKLLCRMNDTPLVLPVVCMDAIFHAFHYKAIAHILPYTTQYEKESWWVSALHIMSLLELKFRGQALLFTPVTAENPKHREYPRSMKHFDAIWRTFIEEIQHEAPTVYQNHSIFKEYKEKLSGYTLTSSTYCMEVTRHLPIVPYAHFSQHENSK